MYFVRYEHKALAFIEKKSIIAPVDGNKRHIHYGPGCIAQISGSRVRVPVRPPQNFVNERSEFKKF